MHKDYDDKGPKGPAPTPTSTIPTSSDDPSVQPGDPSTTVEDPTETIPTSKSKYAGSVYKQQKSPAWLQNWNLTRIGPLLLCMGVVFLSIALFAYLASDDGYAYSITDYTDCISNETTLENSPKTCLNILRKNPTITCHCKINITLPKHLTGTVVMSYELTDFHQNQRNYISSRDDKQLEGELFDAQGKPFKPDRSCIPFDYLQKRIIYPCGKMANSFFSDTIEVYSASGDRIPFQIIVRTGSTHEKTKFVNPKINYKDQQFIKYFSKPIAWNDEVWEEFWKNGGVTGVNFKIWMESTAFNEFRNPYRQLEGHHHIKSCVKGITGMCSGNYTLEIQYRFRPGRKTGNLGRKRIVFSTNYIVSDENRFFFLLSITAGAVTTALGLVSIAYWCRNRKVSAVSSTSKSAVVSPHIIDPSDSTAENQLPELPTTTTTTVSNNSKQTDGPDVKV